MLRVRWKPYKELRKREPRYQCQPLVIITKTPNKMGVFGIVRN